MGLKRVACYLDDILVSGATEEEHLRNLTEVLKRLQTFEIKAKRGKCMFNSKRVEYLGSVG